MKTINWFIATMLMLVVASCTNSDNELLDETSTFEAVKNAYGIEDVSVSISEAGKVPSVSLNEMQSVLEALRAESNQQKSCYTELGSSIPLTSQNQSNKRVVMDSKYTTTTRTGSSLESFLLRVELKFKFENNTVYYYGTDYMYDSQLFDWRANGLSLNPVKHATSLTYEFESESFLYFKVKDQGNCLVKVSVIFKGVFDFKSETGTYSFQLQKYNK